MRTELAMSEPASATRSYLCRYCRLSSEPGGPACPNCGAPVDVREIRDDAGWVEQPPVRDMARIQLGRSRCQISGTTVPVAELDLAPDDRVYFPHHVLLWTNSPAQVAARPMPDGWDRRASVQAAMPLVMLEAAGPGRIAFAENHPGEIIAVPLEAGSSVHVAEHHFLAATASVAYHWFNPGIWLSIGTGKYPEYFHPLGQFMDRFVAAERGLLLLHARGNVMIRDLRPDERIYVVPRALVYKDLSVRMNIHMERPASPRAHWRLIPMVRLVGPGRVAIQSQYAPEEIRYYGWDNLGPDGGWRNWNADTSAWRPLVRDEEP
jgi:uncharacterized protein (AIM24 family)